MTSLPTIRGASVLIRSPRLHDAPPLFRYLQDSRITRNFSFKPPDSIDDVRSFLKRSANYRRLNIKYVFVIANVTDGQPLGLIWLLHIVQCKSAQIVTWITPDCWGRGINAEAKRLLFHFAFDQLQLHRVEARITVENVRSWKAFEKLGAVREGRLRQAFIKNGQCKDQYLYSILATDLMHLPKRRP